jgi:hypothetical protein
MPVKKNDALISKFKASNAMRKAYGGNAVGVADFKEKVRAAVKRMIDKFQEYINGIIQSLDDVDKRVQAIENLL